MFMLWGKCPVHLSLQTCEVRSWQISDLAPLVTHANNRKIWVSLRDRYPYPYTNADGRAFIRASRRAEPQTSFAIAVQEAATPVNPESKRRLSEIS